VRSAGARVTAISRTLRLRTVDSWAKLAADEADAHGVDTVGPVERLKLLPRSLTNIKREFSEEMRARQRVVHAGRGGLNVTAMQNAVARSHGIQEQKEAPTHASINWNRVVLPVVCWLLHSAYPRVCKRWCALFSYISHLLETFGVLAPRLFSRTSPRAWFRCKISGRHILSLSRADGLEGPPQCLIQYISP